MVEQTATDPEIYDTPLINVNTVIPTTQVLFTPFGSFSDGSLQVLSNTNAQGANIMAPGPPATRW